MDAARRPASRRHHPRHQVLRPQRPALVGPGQQPQERHAGDRRLAAAARDRLRRPLPDPLLRPVDADRRDAAGDGRPRASPARCATSAARTRSPTNSRARSVAASCTASAASRACNRGTTCCSARTSASCSRSAPRSRSRSSRTTRSPAACSPASTAPGAPTEGTRFTLGRSQDDVPRALLAGPDVRDRRRAACGRRGRRRAAHDARDPVGARQPGDHVADRRRQPTRSAGCLGGRRRHTRSTPTSRRGSTRSPPSYRQGDHDR